MGSIKKDINKGRSSIATVVFDISDKTSILTNKSHSKESNICYIFHNFNKTFEFKLFRKNNVNQQ